MTVTGAEVETGEFCAAVLDSLTEQVAVIDGQGVIVWVNHSWREFSAANGGNADKTWRAANYIGVCSDSAHAGDRDGDAALAGIRSVMSGEQPEFYLEYPCHSPTESRWFMMRIRSLGWTGVRYFVITHQVMTERKLAEMRVAELVSMDGLTGIANRRRFDAFLDEEWRRGHRMRWPVSIALIDVDFFKPFNDHYGHLAGDECLRRLAEVLRAHPRRPGDLVARYGGEEFALVLGNTEDVPAGEIAAQVRADIEALGIAHTHATQAGCVTVSIGVATRHPSARPDQSPADLVAAADRALYAAKDSGRNCVCLESDAIAS